jgi:predicted Zn-dependent peptidase
MSASHPCDARVARLPNGVRIVTLRRPQVASASVSVYIASGSVHETRATNGLHHVLEHMVFKGTTTRDARRINLDAERLGAEVDAHTDKDHTAFHLRGLAGHATEFVRLLADLVGHPTFPEDEVERERQVLLHEFADDEDDPVSTAFKLFDRACWGSHPASWPVIGTRNTLERFTREDLAGLVAQRYCGANTVVAAAGDVDPLALEAAVAEWFGAWPAGEPVAATEPVYVGGLKSRRLSGSGQVQAVIGWPIAPLRTDDTASRLAATLFGEGMSSPLMHRLREQRALAYYAACSADVLSVCGQFVVEASTSAAQAPEVLAETLALLRQQAERLARDDLERARRQLEVRLVRSAERPSRELEDAVLDLLALGRVRTMAERREAIATLAPRAVRRVFESLVETPPAVAVTGPVGRALLDRLREQLPA